MFPHKSSNKRRNSFRQTSKDNKLLTISGIFIWNEVVAAAKESFERLFEVGIEGYVDDWVDHGMGVREHVDPKLILFQPERKLEKTRIIVLKSKTYFLPVGWEKR